MKKFLKFVMYVVLIAVALVVLLGATEIDTEYNVPKYFFDKTIYDNRVYDSKGVAHPEEQLVMGPNIKDWPDMPALTEDLLVRICAYITDPVTTTDELIPSGETSSYRSNPERLSEFALSRRDPDYVPRSKVMRQIERDRQAGGELPESICAVYDALKKHHLSVDPEHTDIGSAIYANMPGDGSAREQAASCQRVMGGSANFARQYATKRYRSNLINWGMLPFLIPEGDLPFALGDYLFIPDVYDAVTQKKQEIPAYVVKQDGLREFTLTLGDLTDDEREIIEKGCLINYYYSDH